MLMPSLFNDNFDLWNSFSQDPWFGGFDDREMKNLEKKLYGHRAKNVMNTDIKENENGYQMEIDLPGFSKEEVSVELEKGYLTVKAVKEISNDNDKNYIRRERYSGSCQRSFYVGENLTHEDIKAMFKHGILTLDIPKKDPDAIENKKLIAIEG